MINGFPFFVRKKEPESFSCSLFAPFLHLEALCLIKFPRQTQIHPKIWLFHYQIRN